MDRVDRELIRSQLTDERQRRRSQLALLGGSRRVRLDFCPVGAGDAIAVVPVGNLDILRADEGAELRDAVRIGQALDLMRHTVDSQ